MSPDQVEPAVLWADAAQRLQGWGVWDTEFCLEADGNLYRVAAGPQGLAVYRVASKDPGAHGLPGWPVLLLDEHGLFEECRATGLGGDHFCVGRDLTGWLELLAEAARAPLTESHPLA